MGYDCRMPCCMMKKTIINGKMRSIFTHTHRHALIIWVHQSILPPDSHSFSISHQRKFSLHTQIECKRRIQSLHCFLHSFTCWIVTWITNVMNKHTGNKKSTCLTAVSQCWLVYECLWKRERLLISWEYIRCVSAICILSRTVICELGYMQCFFMNN